MFYRFRAVIGTVERESMSSPERSATSKNLVTDVPAHELDHAIRAYSRLVVSVCSAINRKQAPHIWRVADY